MSSWIAEEIKYYYDGIRLGEYPRLIWELLREEVTDCHSLLDVASGPGAFALSGLSLGWQVTATDINPLPLSFLEAEAKRLALPGELHTVCGDFKTVPLEKADMMAAAYCFCEPLAGEDTLGRMLDLGRKLAVFVTPGKTWEPEFLTAGIPEDKRETPRLLEENSAHESLRQAAKKRGLVLKEQALECDFGCPHNPADQALLSFLSRKTGVADLQLLAEHLNNIAVQRNNMPWLPNPRNMTVLWTNKKS